MNQWKISSNNNNKKITKKNENRALYLETKEKEEDLPKK